MKNVTRVLPLLIVAVATGGCALLGRPIHQRTSSVMQYLYPRESEHVDTPTVPVLSLPLKVGVAFVPDARRRSRDSFQEGDGLAEEQKIALMKKVSADFKQHPFVGSIELIPSMYLMPEGGFQNLDQLRAMFGIDVMVLLSYDQVQFTDEGLLSLTYWTVVGAYVIQGEKNDTKTMMDAVVYDIASRKLLFRAPGISQVKASATPVNLARELRQDSELGFNRAATNMVGNLQEQLKLFKEQVKRSPEEFKIVNKPGYTGAASCSAVTLILVAAMGIFSIWKRGAA